MVKSLLGKIKCEKANVIVENVIIMPLIFIIIYSLIMNCFIIHDKCTLEAAAKRGAIYAAHCVSDPNYATILEKSGSEKGTLDTSIDVSEEGSSFSFTGIGQNIQAYRYLTSSSANIDNRVKREIEAIVNKTRIPWRELKVDDIDYTCVNYFIYQDITVTLKANYPVPQFFVDYGMDPEYEFVVTAKMTVNDPDEFIRNADMVVDLITDIDNATGGNVQNAIDKISELATKLIDWISI